MVAPVLFRPFPRKECFHSIRDSKHVPELSICFRIALTFLNSSLEYLEYWLFVAQIVLSSPVHFVHENVNRADWGPSRSDALQRQRPWKCDSFFQTSVNFFGNWFMKFSDFVIQWFHWVWRLVSCGKWTQSPVAYSHVQFDSERLYFLGHISSAPLTPTAISVLVGSDVLSHHGRTISWVARGLTRWATQSPLIPSVLDLWKQLSKSLE